MMQNPCCDHVIMNSVFLKPFHASSHGAYFSGKIAKRDYFDIVNAHLLNNNVNRGCCELR